MDSAEAYAEHIAALYERAAPEAPAGLPVPVLFGYIHFKAFTFLNVGPAYYRKYDAFHLPKEDAPASRLDAIRLGCEQIVQFKGLSIDRPLETLGVAGFYALLELFHFEPALQRTLDSHEPNTIVDEMCMRHIVDRREITLYNKVIVKPHTERGASTGGPCPYCGQTLRTPTAKQCRHCGMDWHDPQNVVSRKDSRR